MLGIKSTIKENIREYTMGIALVAIMILFQILTKGVLLKPLNITNLILQNGYVFILAMGMLLCILSGGNIDLSVGSVVAFIGAISGVLIVNNKMPVLPALAITLIIGLLIGAWQGVWIAFFRIPSFIVTLAGMLVFRGLTLVVLQGRTIGPFPKSFQMLSSGFLIDLFPGRDMHYLTILLGALFSVGFVLSEFIKIQQSRKYGFDVELKTMFILKLGLGIVFINSISIVLASYNGISIVMLIILALIFIYIFITKKSVFGRHIYAMGGNEKAARLSGINTRRVLFTIYVNMGFLSALAGIVIAGRLNASSPKAGTGFELDAIAACFIGGASTSGGIGTVIGAIIGALIMGTLNNGMSILGVSIDWQQSIKGIVLLFAVAFDILSNDKSKS
jgi:putative multiple sugar transport system permease protein